MRSRFHITGIQVSDVPTLIDIAERCDLSPWSASDYELEAERADSIMLACSSSSANELLGFIVGRSIPGFESGLDAEIYNIGVYPEHRRSGIGKMLMKHFLINCANIGVHTVWLDVRVGNAASISFYRSLGFAESYRRPAFYSSPDEDAIVMQFAPDIAFEGK